MREGSFETFVKCLSWVASDCHHYSSIANMHKVLSVSLAQLPCCPQEKDGTLPSEVVWMQGISESVRPRVIPGSVQWTTGRLGPHACIYLSHQIKTMATQCLLSTSTPPTVSTVNASTPCGLLSRSVPALAAAIVLNLLFCRICMEHEWDEQSKLIILLDDFLTQHLGLIKHLAVSRACRLT